MHPRRRSHLNARVTWVVLVLRREFPDAGAYLGSEKISWILRGGAVIRIESVKGREAALEAVGRQE